MVLDKSFAVYFCVAEMFSKLRQYSFRGFLSPEIYNKEIFNYL